MKLKLDENLGHATVDLFRQAGYDVETVRNENLSGAPDEEVIAACRREARALITLDLHFSNPLMFKPSKSFGIAVLRLPSTPSYDDLRIVCNTLLRRLHDDSLCGKLWSVERGRVREYRPDTAED